MIIENPNFSLKEIDKRKYIESGVIIDSFVLIIYFLSMYVADNKNKNYTLKCCNVNEHHINCLNSILQGFRIKKLIITTNILSEFLNKIRRDLKKDYKDIKSKFMSQLIEIDEIHIPKNILLNHNDFIDFGNDISLLIASEENIKNNKYSTIISLDGRFINKFFDKRDDILAFNMNVLSCFF